MDKKTIILVAVSRAVTKLLLDDRKDDPELGAGEIDRAVARGDVTLDELAETFKRELSYKLDPAP